MKKVNISKTSRLVFSLMIGLAVSILCGAKLQNVQTGLSDKLIRLHVVAESDSEYDQGLKLEVRDAVLLTAGELTKGCETVEEVENALAGNLEVLLKSAENVILLSGADYPVSVSLGTESFPTRYYDSFTLPAGEYKSLRVTIGSGGGKNWWCVVFPPICMSATSEELTETASTIGISEKELDLIVAEGEGYVLKLKSLEILETLKNWIGF